MPFARRSGSKPVYRTAAHRTARAELLRNYQPGDPCCLCSHPMWPPTRNLHADHDPITGDYRGLAHGTPCQVCGKRCNQSDGARRGAQIVNGNREQLRTTEPLVTSRRW
jgi:hypothetical protein